MARALERAVDAPQPTFAEALEVTEAATALTANVAYSCSVRATGWAATAASVRGPDLAVDVGANALPLSH